MSCRAPESRAWVSRFGLLLVFALSLLAAGCATPLKPNQVRVTFASEPPGAMIYDGDKAWGTAPVKLVLTGTDSNMRNGYADASGFYAAWPSGAKSRTGVRIFLGRGDQQLTFSRPADAPGLNIDLAHAAKLRQIQAKEQADLDTAFYRGLNSVQEPAQTRTTCFNLGGGLIDCTSH